MENVNNYITRIEMARIVSMADMILNGSDFDNSKELKHVKVKEYKHMGRIDMPRAQ